MGFDFDPSSLTDYHPFISIDSTNSHNVWQVGKPNKAIFTSAYTPPNAIVTDTVGHYPANDGSIFILKLPGYYPFFGAPLSIDFISFYYQLDIDSGDIARVEISEDSGHNWFNPLDTLPSIYWWATWLADTPVFSQSTIGWKRFVLERQMFYSAPDSVLMRFTFISDDIDSVRDGWMIDHMEFVYSFEGVSLLQNPNLISVYPNPSKGNIYIHTTKQYADAKLTIYNTLGQEVYHTESPPQNGYLNLPLPSGSYTLKYFGGDEYCVKRIIITK